MFIMFDDVLKNISRHNREFLILLTDEISSLLADNDHIDNKDDQWTRAIHDWIVHISKSKTWENHRQAAHLNVEQTVEYLKANPGYWTLMTAYNIIEGTRRMHNKHKKVVLKAWECLKDPEAANDKFGDLEEKSRIIQEECPPKWLMETVQRIEIKQPTDMEQPVEKEQPMEMNQPMAVEQPMEARLPVTSGNEQERLHQTVMNQVVDIPRTVGISPP